MVINSVRILLDISRIVLFHRVVDTLEIWDGHRMFPPSAVYKKNVCWTKREIVSQRRKDNMFLRNLYNISLVADCKFCNRFNVLMRSTLLKFNCYNDFLFVVFHSSFVVICMIESTLEGVHAEAVWMDNFQNDLDCFVFHLKGYRGNYLFIFDDGKLKSGLA